MAALQVNSRTANKGRQLADGLPVWPIGRIDGPKDACAK
jgi:hypothetical protein